MRTTIDSYKARAGRLDLEGIEFGDFRDQPLAPDALRSLRYMHDIEHHTVCTFSENRKMNRALSRFILDGATIVVCGFVRSIVRTKESGVGSTWPASSTAAT